MITMPMRELHQLYGGEVWSQASCISTPDVILRTGIEQNRVFDIAFGGSLFGSVMHSQMGWDRRTTRMERPWAEQQMSSI